MQQSRLSWLAVIILAAALAIAVIASQFFTAPINLNEISTDNAFTTLGHLSHGLIILGLAATFVIWSRVSD